MLDLALNPDRFDSWAGMALAKASKLEAKLNAVSRFTLLHSPPPLQPLVYLTCLPTRVAPVYLYDESCIAKCAFRSYTLCFKEMP